RRLDMRAGGGHGIDLDVEADLVHHGDAHGQVALARDGDVVVAGIVEARIPGGVVADLDPALAALERLQVRRRVIVIVNVNDGWHGSGSARGARAHSMPELRWPAAAGWRGRLRGRRGRRWRPRSRRRPAAPPPGCASAG